VTLSSPNSIIRIFEVYNNKIQRYYKGAESIECIQEHATLYAEVIYLCYRFNTCSTYFQLLYSYMN
jgi:hypothetical protein